MPIIQTHDMEKIAAYLDAADPNTLVIFDVDDVLLQAQDQILRGAYHHQLAQNFDPADWVELCSLIWLQKKIVPVHEAFVPLTQSLQSRGVKILALTNCMTGSFGHILSTEEWRIQELKSLDYHFNHSWLDLPQKEFRLFEEAVDQKSPLFKEGIVYTNGIPKGEALQAFLNYAQFLPERIIFLDDLLMNLTSVGASADKLGLGFLGIEYTGAQTSSEYVLDLQRIQLQLDLLKKEKRWFSDSEIEELIAQGFSSQPN